MQAEVDSDVDADVVVVGYGPVGMVTAALLGRLGHRVLVLERYSGLYGLPRAAIFDDETMRTFAQLGVADDLLPKLHVQHNYEWRNGAGELLIEHSFDATGRSGWAEWYMMYQPELEDALHLRCTELPGVDVRFGAPVTGVEDGPGHVTVTVGAQERRTARYVIACDGGNSFVRGALGVDQDDYGFSEPWMVCDFRFLREVDLPTARQVGDPRQPVSIISLGPAHHRFSFMLDSEADFLTERDPAKVWARVAPYLAPEDADLIRVATYTFRSLVAHRWRTGRILLAGDAAHQMPPFLGQGMCSGVRDAQNIAFKLDLVLRGVLDAEVLDTYQSEREPHVRAVIEKGIELGSKQTVRDPAVAAERDRVLLAQRAAHQEPEKIRFPSLGPGMLADASTPGRGALSVQGIVEVDGVRGRFDQVVGTGFALLLDGAAAPLPDDVAAALGAAGVHVVTLGAGCRDVEGTYARWFAEHGWSAVAVRPDLYVFGATAGCADPSRLAEQLLAALGLDVPSPQPAH